MVQSDDVIDARRAIVDQLRRGRSQFGLTQADLADVLDLARATVNRLESTSPSPVLDNLIRALHLVGYELVAVPGDDPLVLAARHGAVPRAPRRVNRPS